MESADITESGHGQSRLRRQKMTTKDKLKNCVEFVKRNGFTVGEFFLEFIRSSEYSRENSRMCEAGWDRQILDEWWQTRGSRRTLPCIKEYALAKAEEVYTDELAKIAQDATLQSSDQPVALANARVLDREFLTGKYQDAAPHLSQLVTKLVKSSTTEESAYRRVTILSQLVTYSSQKKNLFQFSMAVYLYACNCPKQVIEVLNQAGLSVSYNTLIRGL